MAGDGSKWSKLPDWLARRTDITPAAKIVYAAIGSRMGGNILAWPGMRRLAADSGLSLSATARAIDILDRAGLIRIDTGEGRKTNRYTLTSHTRSVPLAGHKTPPLCPASGTLDAKNGAVVSQNEPRSVPPAVHNYTKRTRLNRRRDAPRSENGSQRDESASLTSAAVGELKKKMKCIRVNPRTAGRIIAKIDDLTELGLRDILQGDPPPGVIVTRCRAWIDDRPARCAAADRLLMIRQVRALGCRRRTIAHDLGLERDETRWSAEQLARVLAEHAARPIACHDCHDRGYTDAGRCPCQTQMMSPEVRAILADTIEMLNVTQRLADCRAI